MGDVFEAQHGASTAEADEGKGKASEMRSGAAGRQITQAEMLNEASFYSER